MQDLLKKPSPPDHYTEDKRCHRQESISLVACPIFTKELESCLNTLGLKPHIDYMHYTIHNNPLIMDEELHDSINRAARKNSNVRFLLGRHCKGRQCRDSIVEDCGGKIPQAKNCIEILIGDKRAQSLQKGRTSLMTPAWIRMINQSIADGQWTVTDARLNLGWYNKILILDTGVEPLSDEMIMEFYDLTQVEIEVLPMDLDYFRNLLQELLN